MENPLSAFAGICTETELCQATGRPLRTQQLARQNGKAPPSFVFNRVAFYVVRSLPPRDQEPVRALIARRQVSRSGTISVSPFTVNGGPTAHGDTGTTILTGAGQ